MFFNEILMNIINRHLICINYNKVNICEFFFKKNIAAVLFTCASTFVQNCTLNMLKRAKCSLLHL